MNTERISTILLFCALLLAFVLPMYRIYTGNHNLDVVYHYEMGKYLLEGQKPYIDFTDMNFPTIWYLSTIPAAISNIVGNESFTLLLCIIILTGVSFYFIQRIVYDNNVLIKTEKNFFLIVFLFVVSNFQANSYGQREHLFFVMYLPYILRRTFSINEKKYGLSDTAIGCMAITGIMLKPYFVFAAIIVEIILFIRRNNLSKLHIHLFAGMAIGCFVWGGILLYYIGDYLRVASYAASTYAGQNSILGFNPLEQIAIHKLSFIVYVSVLLFFIIFRIEKKTTVLHEVLTCTGVLLLVAAIVQMKGYDYHIRVGASFSIMSLYIATMLIMRNKSTMLAFAGKVSVYGLITILFAWQIMQGYSLNSETVGSREDVVVMKNAKKTLSENLECKTIYKLSTFAQPLYPSIIDYSIKDVTGFNSFWFLGSFYNNASYSAGDMIYHNTQTMNELEKFFFNKVIDDLLKHQPDLLIVSEPGNNFFFSVPNFDIFKYYSQDERFVSLFSEYHPIAQSDGHIWYKRNNISQ